MIVLFSLCAALIALILSSPSPPVPAEAAETQYYAGNTYSGYAHNSGTMGVLGGTSTTVGYSKTTNYIQTHWNSAGYFTGTSVYQGAASLTHRRISGFSKCFFTADTTSSIYFLCKAKY